MVLPGVATFFLVGRQQSVEVRRAGFSLEVPAEWHIDTSEDDYDAERRFTVLAPLETPTHVLFYIYDEALDAQAQADFMSARMAQTHPGALRASFTRWGNYQGQGREVRDPTTNKSPSISRIFVYSANARSFMVIEAYFAGYEKRLQPGLEQLASSFRLVDHVGHD